MITTKNLLLEQIGLRSNSSRPSLPHLMNSSLIRESNQFARIWIKTTGCQHSIKHGGCVSCDYWAGGHITQKTQLDSLINELQQLENNPPKALLLNTNGSFFDDKELSQEIRIKMFTELQKRLPETKLIIETRVETISKSVIDNLNMFDTDKIIIEIGVETATQAINTLCCNKNLEISRIQDAVSQLKSAGIKVFANVLIGLPFLTDGEIISDAIYTIEWLFQIGCNACVLFPVNIKPFTTLSWLHSHGFYKHISLWVLVDILCSLKPEQLQHIEISWYPALERIKHPLYKEPITVPVTCSKCGKEVNKLLTDFTKFKHNRINIVNKLSAINCLCKKQWDKKNNPNESDGFPNRLINIYSKIAIEAFGQDWQKKHWKTISKQISTISSTITRQ